MEFLDKEIKKMTRVLKKAEAFTPAMTHIKYNFTVLYTL
jgi:hypothetical protein